VFLPGVSAMMLYDTQYALTWVSPLLQVFTWAVFLSSILLAVGMLAGSLSDRRRVPPVRRCGRSDRYSRWNARAEIRASLLGI
jgi:hypothetical protein